MKAKRSVKGMLISACVLLVMVVSVILGGIAIWGIKSSTSMAIEEYKIAMNDGYNSEIKSEVQSVIHVLNTEYDRVQSGEITEEEESRMPKRSSAVCVTVRMRAVIFGLTTQIMSS